MVMNDEKDVKVKKKRWWGSNFKSMSKLFLKEDYNTIKKRKVGPQKRLFKANVSDRVEKIS